MGKKTLFDCYYYYYLNFFYTMASSSPFITIRSSHFFFYFINSYITNGRGIPKNLILLLLIIFTFSSHITKGSYHHYYYYIHCIIHSILRTITHLSIYLCVPPEKSPQSQYNAILQLFDAVYFLFVLCKEWQSEKEKKTDDIASMQ